MYTKYIKSKIKISLISISKSFFLTESKQYWKLVFFTIELIYLYDKTHKFIKFCFNYYNNMIAKDCKE